MNSIMNCKTNNKCILVLINNKRIKSYTQYITYCILIKYTIIQVQLHLICRREKNTILHVNIMELTYLNTKYQKWTDG